MNNLDIAMKVREKFLPKNTDFIGFDDTRLKTGKYALRCTLDRVLSAEEVRRLAKCKKVVGADCVTHHRYAPEIRYSYFYVTA